MAQGSVTMGIFMTTEPKDHDIVTVYGFKCHWCGKVKKYQPKDIVRTEAERIAHAKLVEHNQSCQKRPRPTETSK